LDRQDRHPLLSLDRAVVEEGAAVLCLGPYNLF
jgi:hypothetical protein